MRFVMAALVAVVALGCGPGGSELNDPKEILAKTIAAGRDLRTAHFRLAVQLTASGQNQSATVEGDADFEHLAASVSASAEMPGFGPSMQAAMVVAGGSLFVQAPNQGRWQKIAMDTGLGSLVGFGDPEAAGGPALDIPALLLGTLGDASTIVELRGIEDCATGRCYRVGIVISAQGLIDLAMAASGLDQTGGSGRPDASLVPPLVLEFLSDTTTFGLVAVAFSADTKDVSVRGRLDVGRMNEPVTIDVPAPGLVDEPDFGFGPGPTMVILNDVGNEVIDPEFPVESFRP